MARWILYFSMLILYPLLPLQGMNNKFALSEDIEDPFRTIKKLSSTLKQKRLPLKKQKVTRPCQNFLSKFKEIEQKIEALNKKFK